MASPLIEQQIIEQLQGLDEHQKQRVLKFMTLLKSACTARELLSLPAEERQCYVAAAFEAAAEEEFEIFEA